jgi:hypothetical protein
MSLGVKWTEWRLRLYQLLNFVTNNILLQDLQRHYIKLHIKAYIYTSDYLVYDLSSTTCRRITHWHAQPRMTSWCVGLTTHWYVNCNPWPNFQFVLQVHDTLSNIFAKNYARQCTQASMYIRLRVLNRAAIICCHMCTTFPHINCIILCRTLKVVYFAKPSIYEKPSEIFRS